MDYHMINNSSKSFSIDIISGARPNFIKISSIINAILDFSQLKYRLIHTGQHYDKNMSEIFFKQLKIKSPILILVQVEGLKQSKLQRL